MDRINRLIEKFDIKLDSAKYVIEEEDKIVAKYKFDCFFSNIFHGRILQYGIFKGNDTIILIKPGQDGSLIGYKNKYYNLATYLNSKYGYTIVCCNNPYDRKYNSLEDAVNVIEEYVKEMNFEEYKIYFLGTSNGGVLGAKHCYLYPNIKRFLMLNPPLFIFFNNMKEGLKKFDGEKIVFLYGDLDPSYMFTWLLDLVGNDKISYNILEDEDHNLSNNHYTLEELVEKYLIN